MTDRFEIVPMTADMAEALHAVEIACFSDPWRIEDFRSAADTPGQAFFAARDREDGAIVGFGGLWGVMDEADILNLAVLPEYRRAGIGRALMQTLCDHAGANGIETLFLEVRCTNAPAIALYRSFGFVPYGTRAGYYKNPREDAVLMRRAAAHAPAGQ